MNQNSSSENFDRPYMAERNEAVDRQEVIDSLIDSMNNQEPLILSPHETPISLFCELASVDDDFVLIGNPIPPQLAPYVMFASSYNLFCRSYWIKSHKLVPHGTQLKFYLESFGNKDIQRTLARQTFSERDRAFVEIQHPFDKATVLRRRIFDLSAGGISFRARRQTPFMQAPRMLPQMKIFINSELVDTRGGQIVYVKQIIDENGENHFQVGVRFDNSKE